MSGVWDTDFCCSHKDDMKLHAPERASECQDCKLAHQLQQFKECLSKLITGPSVSLTLSNVLYDQDLRVASKLQLPFYVFTSCFLISTSLCSNLNPFLQIKMTPYPVTILVTSSKKIPKEKNPPKFTVKISDSEQL